MAFVFSALTSILLVLEGATMGNEDEPRLWVEALARRIRGSGLAELARLGFGLMQPVTFLGAQALLLAQPLVSGFVEDTTFERALLLLESPQLQEHLMLSLKSEEG